jgi:KDO2-lipid IV(A) lauroyltransferase
MAGMPTETAAADAAPPEGAAPVGAPAAWIRLIGALPWPVLYGFASCLAFLAERVVRYRHGQVQEKLTLAFPDAHEARLAEIQHGYYRGFADMLVEIVKSTRMSAAAITERVTIRNVGMVQDFLDRGTPVLLVAAHQCNWEWMLLALSLELGFPLDAAYKPLIDNWAEREMLKIRSRFGGRLVPAQTLLADMIKRREVVRAIAIVADQEPVSSERKHWTRFLNRDTAFYMGPEEITRVTRYPALFIAMRRLGRGRYEMEFRPLAGEGEALAPGALTERYARLVEEQIRAAPQDWPWSHKRWKLKRPLYRAH